MVDGGSYDRRKFLESLPENPLAGAIKICEEIIRARISGIIDADEKYGNFLELYALFSTYSEIQNIEYSFPVLTEDRNENLNRAHSAAIEINEALKHTLDSFSIEDFKTRFQAELKGGFFYEFSEGDLQRIQTLLDELRTQISGFVGFEEGHRERLLRRLERLQSELHKKTSDLDRFWGLVGDAGVVLGKFGKDAKPLADRIREIAGIVWNTQARKEELPSGTPLPMLTHDVDVDVEE